MKHKAFPIFQEDNPLSHWTSQLQRPLGFEFLNSHASTAKYAEALATINL